MKAKPLEKVFYMKGIELTFEQAKERALLFLHYIRKTDTDLADYWYGIADNWDLNIWMPNDEDDYLCMALYPVKNGECDYNTHTVIYPTKP